MTEQKYKIVPMAVCFGIKYYIEKNGEINLFDCYGSYEQAKEEIERCRMTEQIKSAIESLDDCIKNQPCECEDFKLAISSLQAWDEVLHELEERRLNSALYETKVAYQIAIEIINQKLAEIEEVR